MSKPSKIKWRDKDTREIARLVKNYNAKLKRLGKKAPNTVQFLPERLTVKSVKEKIASRADFNRVANSIARFSRKGSETLVTLEGGFTTTKYEIEETKIATRNVNIKRAKERKKLGIAIEKGNLQTLEKASLKPKKFSENKTKKEWEKFRESLERELKSDSKDQLLEEYKVNYIQALKDNLGLQGEALANKLEKLSAETIYNKSRSDPLLSIDFIYDPLETEIILEAKYELWSEVANE